MKKNMVIIISILFVIALAVIVVAASLSQERESESDKMIVRLNGHEIIADVAATTETREKGLGGRQSLGENEGMLFDFGAPGFHGIWMKDMRFPIDIIWISGEKIVSIEENVDPQIGADESALKTFFPKNKNSFVLSDRVLELGAGRARMFGAKIGDVVGF